MEYRLDIHQREKELQPKVERGLLKFPHLFLGVAVAAHGPQVPHRPPQQDDKEAAEERDHGRGQEGPPHALTITVARHVVKVWDDQVHLPRVGHHGVLGGLEPNVTIFRGKHAGAEPM